MKGCRLPFPHLELWPALTACWLGTWTERSSSRPALLHAVESSQAKGNTPTGAVSCRHIGCEL
jgi:hypothetical protein